uniref:NADH dehydrogenase subunit 1 n=1 Tax=Lagria rufipennis TaxID=1738060 RepID=UPI0021769DBF|nr:NADH dehydrogenase subunit 1 [Lagria rufipennis]UUL71651.1 NADH dehydrogenase subunit 1 [Lagria rufipennis]
MYLFDLMIVIFSMLMLIIFILISVAFLTLLERKILGYIQIRKGPNKTGYMGILQPFSDAIKLFSKEQSFPFMSNLYIYYFMPMINLLISLFLWLSIPFISWFLNFNFSILFFLCISSLSVYCIMMAGWSSNSNFSLLGSLRCIAQSISYEVSLSLILMSLIFMCLSFNFVNIMSFQYYIIFMFITLPLFMMWFISCLAETNRTPFDFAEGESELVSGFNIEYSSGGFAMIFLAEYSNIIFMSFISCLLFLSSTMFSLMFFLKASFLVFLFILVRGTLPRFRYDKLMYLAWKSFLPISLNYLMMFFNLKMFLIIFFI